MTRVLRVWFASTIAVGYFASSARAQLPKHPENLQVLPNGDMPTWDSTNFSADAGRTGAQEVPNRETAIEVRKQFLADLDTLQGKFLALATAIPADKYSWRPAAGVRSVGEVLMHVASEFYFYAPLAYGAEPSPVVGRGADALKAFESKSSQADVLTHLRQGFAYARRVLTAIDPSELTGSRKLFGGNHTIIETTLDMTDDLHEHLGQLIAYARMNGVKPPWTK